MQHVNVNITTARISPLAPQMLLLHCFQSGVTLFNMTAFFHRVNSVTQLWEA